jgi:hypothetical protein
MDFEGRFCTLSGIINCRRWPSLEKVFDFEGSAGFEETKALIIAESALDIP